MIERRIGQRPEVLGGLEFWGIGWEEVQVDVVGHAQAQTGMPSGSIQDQDDLLLGTGSRLARKGGELRFKERDAHRGGEMEQRAA